jgi:hypothetical protein
VALTFAEMQPIPARMQHNAGRRLDPMKDNPDLPWVKQQIRRTLADYNARVTAAAASPVASVPEPARPAPEKRPSVDAATPA